jgi:hypothetical protein
MRHILFLSLFLSTFQVFACEIKVLNSCRDSFTKNISKSRVKRSVRKLNRDLILKNSIDTVFQSIDLKTTHSVLFQNILKISVVNKNFKNCLNLEESSQESCYRDTLAPYIYYGYGMKYFDATATIVLLSKLRGGKDSSYVGNLDSYARKVDFLRKSYLKNQEVMTNTSPLSIKKYLKKLGSLKRLTPRQNTLLKYNYSQIKFMGKIMQTFERRILSLESGLFFDYDGDGNSDETYALDEADKYRMSVKLLKLELEKLSHSGKIFAGNKPTFHDLLVASNELGLISDKDLEAMVELPFLYEKKKSPWRTAGEISWTIGKGIVMAIPGANLYSIIPIVLVESYINSKEQQDETSNLHLFTF